MDRHAAQDPEAILAETEWVRRLCRILCDGGATADDLAQDALIAGLASRMPRGASPRAWLRGIVRNQLRSNRRSERVRREHEEVHGDDLRRGGACGLDEGDVLDSVLRAESHRSVVDAVLTLREPYRSTVLARYFDGEGIAEMAERFGVSRGAVKARLSRGVAELREELRSIYPAEAGTDRDQRWLAVLAPLCVPAGSPLGLSARGAAFAAAGQVSSLTALIIMTSKILVCVAAAAAIAFALLPGRFGVPSLNFAQANSAADDVQAVRTAPLESDAVSAAPSQEGSRVDAAVDPEPEEVADAPLAEGRQIFTGRVVDEFGAPVGNCPVDIGVPLASKDWKDLPGIRVMTPYQSFRCIEVRTAADGRFREELPAVMYGLVRIVARPGPQRSASYLTLSASDRRNSAPLTAGVCDVGDVMTWKTGAIYGFVRDDVGAPVVGARVSTCHRATSSLPGTNAYAITAKDGSFEMESAPPGHYALTAEKDGYVQLANEHVSVEVGRALRGVEVRCPRAPCIHGRVIDPDGGPLKDAHVEGWPQGSGSSTTAISDASGHFSLPLPSPGGYRFVVSTPGFLHWGNAEEPGAVFDPSDKVHLIEMTPLPPLEFVVVENDGFTPIEEFQLAVVQPEVSGAGRGSWVRVKRGEGDDGDSVVTGARPGVDRVVVKAPGYLRTRVSVAPTGHEGTLPAQVIELEEESPTSASVGVLTRPRPGDGAVLGDVTGPDGFPLAGELVELQYVRSLPGEARPKKKPAERSTRLNAAGEFRFDGLVSGTYQLRYVGAARVMRTVKIHDVRVGQEEPVEVAIDLHGQELTAVGVDIDLGGLDVGGWMLQLADPGGNAFPIIDRGPRMGRVSFVPPGETYSVVVGLSERRGMVDGSVAAKSGETTHGDFELLAGSARLDFPADLVLPGSGYLVIELANAPHYDSFEVPIESGAPVPFSFEGVVASIADGVRLTIGPVPSGAAQFRVWAQTEAEYKKGYPKRDPDLSGVARVRKGEVASVGWD